MRALIAAFVLFPSFSLAATPSDYAVICSSPCSVQTTDGQGNPTTTQEPAGYVSNIIVWDGVTPYSPGAGYELKSDADGSIQPGQTVTP